MEKTKQRLAELSLIIVTLGWGVSYYLIDVSLKQVDPFMLNAYRFLIAFFVAGIFSFSKIKSVNGITMKFSFYLGTLLLFVYIGATFGVKYTSLSNTGFLCAMTVVITPFLETMLLKKPLPTKVKLAAAASFVGIMLMTLNEDFSINVDTLPGDLLCIMCATAYAFHLIVTQKAVNTKGVNSYQLGVFQLLFTGIYCLIMSLVFYEPTLPHGRQVVFAVLFLAIFCTGMAFIIQTLAQRYTRASRVGIIFTLEPVFAAIVAYVFAGEMLSIRGYMGALIMILAILFMETNFKLKNIDKKKTKFK